MYAGDDVAPAQEQAAELTSDADLNELLTLLTSRGLIRRTHKLWLLKGKLKPAWFWLPKTRRSFRAVLRLQAVCSTESVRKLLSLRWIAVYQLEDFIKRTKLGDGEWAAIETAIRNENERTAAHTNTGMTGALTRIAAGEPRSEALQATIEPGKHRRAQRGVRV